MWSWQNQCQRILGDRIKCRWIWSKGRFASRPFYHLLSFVRARLHGCSEFVLDCPPAGRLFCVDLGIRVWVTVLCVMLGFGAAACKWEFGNCDSSEIMFNKRQDFIGNWSPVERTRSNVLISFVLPTSKPDQVCTQSWRSLSVRCPMPVRTKSKAEKIQSRVGMKWKRNTSEK